MSNPNWGYSRRAIAMKSNIIRDTLKITKKPGVISFGGGLPASELFPVEELAECARKVLLEQSEDALQYGPTEGYGPLREMIAERMQKLGVQCAADEILITGGSQQGLDLIGRVFFDDGATVIASRPTYLGAIQAFSAYGVRYDTLESDTDGMVVEGIEDLVKRNQPRAIYLVPTFQNPDGRTIPLERRQIILEIAEKYAVPVIEDDPYSELSFEGVIPKHMKSISPESVILLGTYSKLLAPGFRVAWLIAPKGDCYDRFVRMKQGADLQTNSFAQNVIYEYLKTGNLDTHLEKVRQLYSKRRDIMVSMMKKYFPDEVEFTQPNGGLFLWVSLPEGIDSFELLPKAVAKNVAYIPGTAFYADGGGRNAMRLNFSKPKEEEIEVGIKRLGELFAEVLGK